MKTLSLIIFALCSTALACGDLNTSAGSEPNKVDVVLDHLQKTSQSIKTYQAKVVYLNKQTLPETQELMTGMFYFKGDGSSKIRVCFNTAKFEDQPIEQIREEYIFDGIDLTRVNYKLKTVEIRRLSEPNHPLDAFELASRYWPIIGFAKVDQLKNDFDISLVGQTKGMVQLRLITKPSSRYADDYVNMDFYIDTEKWLPLRMVATSPDEIIYDFQLEKAVLNEKFADDVFNIEVPANFDKNVIPLEK
jgi:outer membrane lipoprotein-sorting protein